MVKRKQIQQGLTRHKYLVSLMELHNVLSYLQGEEIENLYVLPTT